MNNYLQKLASIKAFVFDVDGVLTDGSVIATEEGHFLRIFNIKDGYVLQHAIKKGVIICIISGGKSDGIIKRLSTLGITDIYVGQANKQASFDEFITKYNLNPTDIAYMGDDMPDYPILQHVGLKCCPADAAIDIIEISDFISEYNGGKGCVRDLLEKYLKLTDKWHSQEGFVW